MHRSRLWGAVIDCQDLEAGVAFWSAALGVGVKNRNDPYVSLQPTPAGHRLVLQMVPESKTAKTRVHLDIETDDVEAEAQRLEALGARRREMIEGWWVMEDPCGNEFCVVPVQAEDFPKHTRAWE
jgi:predicted enzyme related to lactoylglutathione lyase